jgi:type II secretory pathway pseudopilin PulG
MKNKQAFSIVELLVVVGVIALLVAIALPTASHSRAKSMRLACVNNQAQIGVAYRIWAADHGGKYPAQTPGTHTNGGWADIAKMTNAGAYCWSNFCVMKIELGLAPSILICPADERSATNDFNKVGNKNLSYYFNPGTTENFPRSILGGDRNLGPGTKPKNNYGFSPEDGSGNDVILKTNSPVCWSLKMHSQRNSVGAGNILLGDGSVQQCSSTRLRVDYQANAYDGGDVRTAINHSNSFRLIFP